MNAGLVMLPRTTDKARACVVSRLGEFVYNCTLDKLLFEFLGTDEESFAAAVGECQDDESVAAWVDENCQVTAAEKEFFNNQMRHRRPQTDEQKSWFVEQQNELGRNDYLTYFDNLDADDGRF